MEFTGDEKRIQALFSELSLEDLNHAPHFEKLWRRAEANRSVVRRSALAFVTAAILAAVCLVATWTWYGASQSEQAANIPAQVIPTASEARVIQTEQPLSASSKELRIVHRFTPPLRTLTERPCSLLPRRIPAVRGGRVWARSARNARSRRRTPGRARRRATGGMVRWSVTVGLCDAVMVD